MSKRVRLGVIGLRRGWPALLRTLQSLPQRVTLAVVYDPCLQRTREQARQLGCEATAGVIELLERPDVDALILASPSWQGLWPAEQALARSVPVLCRFCPSVQELESLPQKGTELLHFSLWPELEGLVDLLALRQEASQPPPANAGQFAVLQATWTRQRKPLPREGLLESSGLLALLDVTRRLLSGPLRKITCLYDSLTPHFASILLQFDNARAQFTLLDQAAFPLCEIRLQRANGLARLLLPRQLEWTDRTGQHLERSLLSTSQSGLQRFLDCVSTGGTPDCGIQEMATLLHWRAGIQRSASLGQTIDVPSEATATVGTTV